jgi:hypothetical protein
MTDWKTFKARHPRFNLKQYLAKRNIASIEAAKKHFKAHGLEVPEKELMTTLGIAAPVPKAKEAEVEVEEKVSKAPEVSGEKPDDKKPEPKTAKSSASKSTSRRRTKVAKTARTTTTVSGSEK